MPLVAALVMNSGFFVWVEIAPTAIALGVKTRPARRSTLSVDIKSLASRRATSGAEPPSSRRKISILRPATAALNFDCPHLILQRDIGAALGGLQHREAHFERREAPRAVVKRFAAR